MNYPEDKNHSVDKLLKRTLSDEIPPEVEERMTRQLQEFQRRLDSRERQNHDHASSTFNPAWSQSFWGRTVFACASLSIAFSLFFVQLSGSRSALANTIDAIQATAGTLGAIRKASSLECEIIVRQEAVKPLHHHARWKTPNRLRLDLDRQDRSFRETWWIEENRATVFKDQNSQISTTVWNSSTEGSLHQHLSRLVTPYGLTDWIKSRWEKDEYTILNNKKLIHYVVRKQEKTLSREIFIDPVSDLPVKILAEFPNLQDGGRTSWMIEYQWNIPIDSNLMTPRINRRGNDSVE